MTNLLPIHRVRDKIDDFLSRSNKVDLSIAIILFLSATQLGLHFWPPSAFVYGVRVDYLSPTVYLTDLLLAGFLIVNSRRSPFPIKTFSLLLPILLTNLLFSSNPTISLVWSLRLLLYCAFVTTIPSSRIHTIAKLIPLGLIFQVTLGFLQTWHGQSLQGLFYWLGERALDVSSPNVAKFTLFGETLLRSYGTFSHPNVLAGWLVVGLLIYLVLFRGRPLALLLLTSFGIFLTQSRSAAISLFYFVVPIYFLKTISSRVLSVLIIILLTITLTLSGLFTRSTLSVSERYLLQRLSLKTISSVPFFGSGSSGAISLYPTIDPSIRLLQPDHNSLTLLISWFGFVGTFALLVAFRFSRLNLKYLLPLSPLLLLDHYLFTSPQGLFILVLYSFVTILPNHSQ